MISIRPSPSDRISFIFGLGAIHSPGTEYETVFHRYLRLPEII